MKYILILAGLTLIFRPRLLWRQNPRWFNTGMVQLIFPEKFDVIMRWMGLILIVLVMLQVAGLIR